MAFFYHIREVVLQFVSLAAFRNFVRRRLIFHECSGEAMAKVCAEPAAHHSDDDAAHEHRRISLKTPNESDLLLATTNSRTLDFTIFSKPRIMIINLCIRHIFNLIMIVNIFIEFE